MTKHSKSLGDELRAAGASDHEARELTQLAARLPKLRARQRHSWLPLSLVGALAVLALLIGLAQSSLPGGLLYRVKRVSEQSVALVDPNFKGTIMVRRSAEVQQLVNQHADTSTVFATLSAYRKDARAYTADDYKVFENCKHHLQLAATAASPAESQAILQAIPNV